MSEAYCSASHRRYAFADDDAALFADWPLGVQEMEPEIKALLATQPMRRTDKGGRVILSMASDLPARQMALLRRFTGETLLEYLAALDEPLADLYADAHALYSRGLIAPASAFEQLPTRRVNAQPRDR